MNTEKIVRMAVIVSVYNRGWCQDTGFSEMYEDWPGIVEDAQQHLTEAGIDYTLTENDVAIILWDQDLEELLETAE